MSGYIGTKAVTLSTTAANVGGDSTVGGDLTVDTNTLYVDSTNNRVAVGTTSPEETLDLGDTFPQNIKLGLRGYLGQASSTSGTLLGHSVKAKTVNPTTQELVVTETNSAGGAPSAIYMSNGAIQFHTAASGTNGDTFNSERMRVLSSGGITFNGDTATANALNDYEEGTFTPTSTTNSGTAATFGTASGTYTKIGNVVYFTLDVTNINTTGTTFSSEFRIDGLPFTVDVDGTRAVVLSDNITFQSTRTSCVATISTGEYIQLNSMGTGIGDTAVDYGDLNSGITDVFISGFYFTDQ